MASEGTTLVEALRARIGRWPLPLAYPAEQCLRHDEDTSSSLSWAFRVFGQLLRVPSLYLAGAYLSSSFARAELTSAIADGLRRPSLGHWRGFLRDVIGRLGDTDAAAELVQAARGYHEAVGVRRDAPGPLVHRDGRSIRSTTTVLDAVIQIRNSIEHGPAGLDAERAAVHRESVEPLLLRVIEAFDVFDGHQLVGRTASGEELVLRGPAAGHRDLQRCAVRLASGASVDLHPLAVAGMSSTDGVGDLLLYDGRHEKRLVFVGLLATHERRDLHEGFVSVLESKRALRAELDAVSTWDRARLHEALALRHLQLERDGVSSAPPEVLIPRPQILERCDQLVDGGRPGLLLTGAPGTGRSTMLSVMARNLLARGIPAVVLAADQLGPMLSGSTIAEALTWLLRIPGTLDQTLEAVARPGIAAARLVILIDGLETVGPPDQIGTMLRAISELLAIHRDRGLRIVASVQSQALARVTDSGFDLDESLWLHSVTYTEDGEPIAVPEVPVEPLSLAEAGQLYEALRTRAGSDAPLTAWGLLPPPIRDECRVPARAVLLVEAKQGEAIRHASALAEIDQVHLEQHVLGRRYDARNKRHVDVFPERRALLERIVTADLDGLPSDPSDLEDAEQYGELLRKGILHEVSTGSAGGLRVRVASAGITRAVAHGVLRRDRARTVRLIIDPALDSRCAAQPGLDDAIVSLAMADLHTLSGTTQTLLERGDPIGRALVARALLRIGAIDPDAVGEVVARLLTSGPRERYDAVLATLFAEATRLGTNDAAGVVAVASLDRASPLRAAELLAIARALRRCGRTADAERALREVASDATSSSEARRCYLLGSLIRDQGRWEESLPWLTGAAASFAELDDAAGVLVAHARGGRRCRCWSVTPRLQRFWRPQALRRG